MNFWQIKVYLIKAAGKVFLHSAFNVQFLPGYKNLLIQLCTLSVSSLTRVLRNVHYEAMTLDNNITGDINSKYHVFITHFCVFVTVLRGGIYKEIEWRVAEFVQRGV